MHATGIVTVVVVVLCSIQGAQGNSGHIKFQATPLEARTARPFEPLHFIGSPRQRSVTIVAQEPVMFRESNRDTPYPAILILDKQRYNGTTYFDVSVFDIRNIAAKTWQPFPREIKVTQVLGRSCSEVRWPPTLAASPSKHHLVMYGFGTGQCAEKLVLYGDRRSRVITTTGGHAAMGAALATMAVGESDNSKFDLFAFGGADCLHGRNSSCPVYNSLRILRIDSSETCLHCIRPIWRVLDMSRVARLPSPGVYADMFTQGTSLMLFGGGTPRYSGEFFVKLSPQFWRYGLVTKQWMQLKSNIVLITAIGGRFSPSWEKSARAAFLSREGTMIVIQHNSLHICSISRLSASCTKAKHATRDRELSQFSPTAAHSFYYIIGKSIHAGESFKVEVFRSIDANTFRTRMAPLIDPVIDTRCPAFQGHISFPAIPAPSDDGHSFQYLFFAPVSIKAARHDWFAQNKTPKISIWSIQHQQSSVYDYMYVQKFNSPAPSDCSSVTYLKLSTALLYEKPGRIWCLSIPTYSWSLAATSSSRGPPYRTYHVAYRHRSVGMVLYGGLFEHSRVLGDLWLFQLQEGDNCTGSWHDLTPYVVEGYLPKLCYHAVTEYGDAVIIYGGRHQDGYSPQDNRRSTMFVLNIISKVRVVVRNIEIVPQIQTRIFHSISLYATTGLLILGGEQPSENQSMQLTDDALLMTLGEQNHTMIARWTVFFKFGIAGHTVLNNKIFSGVDSTWTNTRQFFAMQNTNQCPKGYQRNRNNSCLPCTIGYYSPTTWQQCVKCGNLTTTTREGSPACELRNPCNGGYCHGHGTCFVNKISYKPFCTCNFGYVASDRCKVPSVYLALMAAVVFATTATILFVAFYQFVRKRRALKATEIQLGNTHRDLLCHRKKLRRINKGTVIRWSDLTVRGQLASGTYSKVLLAEFSDMMVAVKQFPSYFATGSLSSPYDVFIQEAEILRGLRHPNIVMFIGAGRDATSGCPFLVMEYLRRGSLHDVLHDLSNPIEHCDRLRFALDTAQGIQYLHTSSPPQIHRDIKSPNLLVSDKWVVKVGDLETARFMANYQSNLNTGDSGNEERTPQLGDTGGRTRQHSISFNSATNQLTTPLLANQPPSGNTAGELNVTSRVGMTCGTGTDRWRSPESIKKNLYTEKHDVYSFGVVLWEIITRQTPYSNFTCSEDILDEIVNERKPIFPPSAPYAYRHLAEQCMKTDAVDRPTIQRVVRELIDQFETL